MAEVEKIPDVGERPAILAPQTNKGVARLLKENPYVAGVAVVSATSFCTSMSPISANRATVCFLGRLPLRI